MSNTEMVQDIRKHPDANKCAHCGRDLGHIGGFCLGRDLLPMFEHPEIPPKKPPRRFCQVCVINPGWDALLAAIDAELPS